jgi:thiol-disulfide isomerase/thioredoxin
MKTHPISLTIPIASRALPLGRRSLVQAAIGATAIALAGPLRAAEPAYELSPWRGPLADFRLVDTRGKTWQLQDFAGRAVLLNFWASWCEPCRAEMPALQALAAQHGESRLLVLAINFKEPASRALRFAETTGLTLPVLLDADGRLAASHQVRVFPTTLLLDARGEPRQRVKGELDWTGPVAAQLIAPLILERT